MPVPTGLNIRALCIGPNPILGIGDSRTVCAPWEKVGRYPFLNAGVGGITIKGYLDMWNATLAPMNLGTPYGAIINLGINTAYQAAGTTEYNNVDTDLAALIAAVRVVTPRVIVCTASPQEKGFETAPTQILALGMVPYVRRVNAIIRQRAILANTALVDFETVFAQADGCAAAGMTQDGNHPSKAGLDAHKALLDAAVNQYF